MSVLAEVLKHISLRGLEILGRYYSTYRAFVVDNEDPKNLGRLKVRIPSLTKNSTVEAWIYPKGAYAGTGYGFHFIPSIGDLVYLEFEYGDLKRPLWIHGYHGRDEIPEELNKPNQYWIKTPKGYLILMDEANEVLKLETPNGDTLIHEGGTWIFNGGSNEGMVKVTSLVTAINNIENKINTDVIPALLTLGIISEPLILTTQSEIENSNVKH